jgi:hypothetical protein
MPLILAILLAAAQPADKPQPAPLPPAGASCTPAPPPAAGRQSRIASLLASATGASAQAAIRVRNIHEEYEVLGALGLCPRMQALVEHGRTAYDVLTAIDPRTGASRELWFDISSFFGHEFDGL